MNVDKTGPCECEMSIVVPAEDVSQAFQKAYRDAAKRADIHRTQMKDGMMTMRPMGELILRPGSSVLLRPGGMHVMLMGLTAPLKKGGSFDLTLNFEKAGSLTVKVGIEKIGARAPAAAHGQGHSGSH